MGAKVPFAQSDTDLQGSLWVQMLHSRSLIRVLAGLSMVAKVAFAQSDQSPCRAFYGCKGRIRAVWSETLQGSQWLQWSHSRSLIRVLAGLSMVAKVAFAQYDQSPCRALYGCKCRIRAVWSESLQGSLWLQWSHSRTDQRLCRALYGCKGCICVVRSESLQGSLWLQKSHSRSLLVLAGLSMGAKVAFAHSDQSPCRAVYGWKGRIRAVWSVPAGLSIVAKVAFAQSDQSPWRALFVCKDRVRAVWSESLRALYRCKGRIHAVWSESLQGSLWVQMSHSRSLISLCRLFVGAQVAFAQSDQSPCGLFMGAKVAFAQPNQSPCRALYGCNGRICAVWSESLQGSLWV